MASSIIHICIAKKLNEDLNKNEKELFLGTIAPDISKQIGQDRRISHFIKGKILPDIDDFMDKYRTDCSSTFTLGYLIHLLTDYYWFRDFLGNFQKDKVVTLLDGETVTLEKDDVSKLVYNDYTNLNIKLIDRYNLDLSLFYEDYFTPTTKIDEIPIESLPILIDKMGIIIENSKEEKAYVFNMEMVEEFIDDAVKNISQFINANSLI